MVHPKIHEATRQTWDRLLRLKDSEDGQRPENAVPGMVVNTIVGALLSLEQEDTTAVASSLLMVALMTIATQVIRGGDGGLRSMEDQADRLSGCIELMAKTMFSMAAGMNGRKMSETIPDLEAVLDRYQRESEDRYQRESEG